MQHVKMKETRTGASDRVTVKTYVEGNVYEISDDLAEVFFDGDSAVPADPSEAENNQPSLEELTDDELAAKVLELDPEANPGDVAAAIAANREGVLEKLDEMLAEAGETADAPAGEPDPLLALTKRELVELAKSEDINIPFSARSNESKIAVIKAARAAKNG